MDSTRIHDHRKRVGNLADMNCRHFRVLLLLLLASVPFGLVAADVLPKWDAGYRGKIPDLPIAVRVAPTAIEAQGHIAIQSAVDGFDGVGAVLLPEGVFELR
jgi:hypothetical protein